MPAMPDSPALPKPAPDFFSPQVFQARRFYLDLAPSPRQPLAVVCGGLEYAVADYAIDREDFPYFSIEFVARGKGTLTLSGQTAPLLPGTVFTYGPGVPHRMINDRDDPLVKYFVDFSGRRAAALLRDHALTPGTIGRAVSTGEIQRIFDDLIQNGSRSTRLTTQLCSVLLEYLILKICESLSKWEAAQSPAYATYERCRQYIQANYPRLTGLPQVARQCHVVPAYLCRLFRRYDHQTPYQYLMRLKMNLAAERLQVPGLLVKQVAAELGFEDPFHFSRAFKSVLGLSPEAFRRLR
jgi:AraC-like DNA-binding protein